MARGFQGGQEGAQGLRWLLYRHSFTRSRKNTETLKALEKSNRRIYRAWRLKDEIRTVLGLQGAVGRKKVYRGLDGDGNEKPP